MAEALNQFLSPTDAGFLYLEKPRQSMHIGSCMVCEGLLEKEELERLMLERLHLVPRYRQRVLFPAFTVSHPMWVDDPDFEIERHIDVAQLSGKVDDQALGEAITEAYSGRLDRDRPLWHATLLQCPQQNRTALVWKIHHSMVDGIGSIELMMTLSDLTPDAAPSPTAEVDWHPASLPEPLDLLQEGVKHRLEDLTNSWTESLFDLLRPEVQRQRAKRFRSAVEATLPTLLKSPPRTPFNRPVSGKLGYAWCELSFAEMRQVKGALGGTVNDLVLTTLSGALGRYLRAHHVDTEGIELRASCPVSMRLPEQQEQPGNLVSNMIAPLYVGIENPLERHDTERQAMRRIKESAQAEALYDLSRGAAAGAPFWQAAVAQLPDDYSIFNCVSTNVPGPQVPLFLSGHRVLSWLPLGIVSSNIGLFVAILSYNQKITFGLTVDDEQMPDAWLLTKLLGESFAELRRAADVTASPPVEIRPKAKRSAARRRKVSTA